MHSLLIILHRSIDIGDTGIAFMKVAKYSSVEEVRRIQARLQAVRCGGLTLAVVGLQLDPDCAEIGPLAVDTRFQVIIATIGSHSFRPRTAMDSQRKCDW